MWCSGGGNRSKTRLIGTSNATTAMAMAIMLSPSARVEAFASFREIVSRPPKISRVRLRSFTTEPALRVQQDDDKEINLVNESRSIQSRSDSRPFFERIGSPRYIAAPMVEHSEAVSLPLR